MGLQVRINWKAKLKNALELSKLILLIIMMTLGFYVSYAFILYSCNLELTGVALWFCFFMACLSETVFIRWISN
jgi:hypothetical protein